MKKIRKALILAGIMSCIFLHAADTRYVILKLDDFEQDADPAKPVPAEWQKLYDFFVERDIKGTAGIFAASLERENPAYYQWILDKEKSGRFEFWNHGYQSPRKTLPDGKLEPGQFERSYEEQKHNFTRCQELWRKRFGKPFSVWGPHWSGVNENTARVLREDPSIRIIFWNEAFGKKAEKHALDQAIRLESATGKVDFAVFRQNYETSGKDVPLLVLQGHPWGWRDEAVWQEFVKVVDFLRERNYRFVTPTEYIRLSASSSSSSHRNPRIPE